MLESMSSLSLSPVLQLERLDADLKNYRHNSIKESIRRGYDALGDHHMDCGDLKSVHQTPHTTSYVYH